MRFTRINLLLAIIGLVALHGCSGRGTWFPKGDHPVRTQTYWDEDPERRIPFGYEETRHQTNSRIEERRERR